LVLVFVSVLVADLVAVAHMTALPPSFPALDVASL
jgi:hypothetical protein